MPMTEGVREGYRVQISGPRFDVSYEARPEGDEDPCDMPFAALAIAGALAMASYELPRVTQILANVVADILDREACDIEAVRRAENAFRDAADRLRSAWGAHDAQRRQERGS